MAIFRQGLPNWDVECRSSSFLACNSRLRSAIRRHHPPQRAVWAKSAASGSVRWWCFRSCWMVLSHVMRGRPSCLLQSAGGEANRILLASAFPSMCRWGKQKSRFSANIWLHRVLWTVQLLSAIHTAATDLCKLTLVAGKQRRLFFTRDHDKVFMTRSLNVMPNFSRRQLSSI